MHQHCPWSTVRTPGTVDLKNCRPPRPTTKDSLRDTGRPAPRSGRDGAATPECREYTYSYTWGRRRGVRSLCGADIVCPCAVAALPHASLSLRCVRSASRDATRSDRSRHTVHATPRRPRAPSIPTVTSRALACTRRARAMARRRRSSGPAPLALSLTAHARPTRSTLMSSR